MKLRPDKQTAINWLLKYKLHHIPFWCVYHYIWWVVAMGNPFHVASHIAFSIYAFKFWSYVTFQALAVYFNLYFLIPKLLEKGKFILYILSLTLTIFASSFCILSGYFLSDFFSDKTFYQLFNIHPNEFMNLVLSTALPSCVASMTLAMSIKLTKNWLQSKRRQQLLEKEKLETELKFLKHQFNPHFLFNTINSIFFLIHKNPDMASASLAKFSDLLRYQLYECNDKQIPLGKEIQYMQNFIELEKLRQNQNVSVELNIENENSKHLGIAPFILMTFVENAFKHVSKDYDKQNTINLDLKLLQNHLYFSISNSISTDANTTSNLISDKGIGLKNVQRRLDLLYPENHNLVIKNGQDFFEVDLDLELNELYINSEASFPQL
ncbi:sensor histidine kinase [Chondrinema litorale]|uniref:sensor histidine kinase n=1 Tax=Chondrinema litorale TaxID=2994555 RepID=UPI00254356EE|nr:histidine kinase [Chondrinema litorale]UZR97086.1 histidine kinase [Chondrinema litorale]